MAVVSGESRPTRATHRPWFWAAVALLCGLLIQVAAPLAHRHDSHDDGGCARHAFAPAERPGSPSETSLEPTHDEDNRPTPADDRDCGTCRLIAAIRTATPPPPHEPLVLAVHAAPAILPAPMERTRGHTLRLPSPRGPPLVI